VNTQNTLPLLDASDYRAIANLPLADSNQLLIALNHDAFPPVTTKLAAMKSLISLINTGHLPLQMIYAQY
jgi:hypothetical protein